MEWYDVLLCFFVYGCLGWCTEVVFAAVRQRKFVNRGFLNGPICPIYGIGVVSVVVILEPLMDNTVLLYLGAVILVTALEWITGFLLEKLFHHKWWDYSNMPMNLNGYVCVLFSFIWGIACVVIVRDIHPAIYHMLTLPPRWVRILVSILLLLLLAVDLYVSVNGILKLNQRLKKMKTLAEWKEEGTAELKAKYQELLENQSRIEKRVLGAFPKMKPNINEKQFEELKEFLQKKKEQKRK